MHQNQKNFSPFSFPKRSFRGPNPEKESLYFSLKELTSAGLSNDDITSMLNQDLVVPCQIEFMRYNIENLIGASCFFFSTSSILSQRLVEVKNHIRLHLNIYESNQFYNKFFAAEFLYSIDAGVQLWLQQCEARSERDSVDDSYINFSGDMRDVLRGKFKMVLPNEIKDKIRASDQSNESTPSSSEPPAKKRKTGERNSIKVDNPEIIPCWNIGEKYDSILRHNHSALINRPKINNVPMCHRWHSKGYCFNDCNNKITHIPSKSLPDEKKEAYKNWFCPLANNNN